jgi:hypothetical protein
MRRLTTGPGNPEVGRAWDALLALIRGRGLRVADLGCETGDLSALFAS